LSQRLNLLWQKKPRQRLKKQRQWLKKQRPLPKLLLPKRLPPKRNQIVVTPAYAGGRLLSFACEVSAGVRSPLLRG
jgi:hypothetical protein